MGKLTLAGILLITTGYINFSAAPEAVPLNWYSKDWGLHNSLGTDVRAEEAWTQLTSAKRITVAVIHTGIDFTHPALEKDISKYGHNFATTIYAGPTNPIDGHGHGTHVSGIIESVSNGHVLIVPIRYYLDSNPGSVNLRNTVKAIRFAVDHGAKIINYSGGGPEFSEEEYLALKYAEAHNVLVVAAAGNEHKDADLVENYYYPAAYRLSNMISVMGVDVNLNRVPSSNWGKNKVDIAAPGENIFSTLPGGRFGYMTGTSQATPFVTGVAAMMMVANPSLKPKDVKQILMDSARKLDQLKDMNASGGYVDAEAAVRAALSFTR